MSGLVEAAGAPGAADDLPSEAMAAANKEDQVRTENKSLSLKTPMLRCSLNGCRVNISVASGAATHGIKLQTGKVKKGVA